MSYVVVESFEFEPNQIVYHNAYLEKMIIFGLIFFTEMGKHDYVCRDSQGCIMIYGEKELISEKDFNELMARKGKEGK